MRPAYIRAILQIKKVMPLILLFSLTAAAAAPEWQVVPKNSNITFTAKQNNAPISGEFKSYSGDIYFDPDDLEGSKVKISVDLSSLDTPDLDVTNTLKAEDWFDIKQFPHATFVSDKFSKVGQQYQANGMLTLRNKTLPVVLIFTLDKYTPTTAHAIGKLILKRTAFGVGQGEWVETDQIKDEVEVKFELSVVKK